MNQESPTIFSKLYQNKPFSQLCRLTCNANEKTGNTIVIVSIVQTKTKQQIEDNTECWL